MPRADTNTRKSTHSTAPFRCPHPRAVSVAPSKWKEGRKEGGPITGQDEATKKGWPPHACHPLPRPTPSRIPTPSPTCPSRQPHSVKPPPASAGWPAAFHDKASGGRGAGRGESPRRSIFQTLLPPLSRPPRPAAFIHYHHVHPPNPPPKNHAPHARIHTHERGIR